ncbi:peptidase S41 family protein-like protein [Pleomassaria siparia CBS 279.74]|uniref:Peptidase S41 family protein-like protein n=1 Tax=Pleomassaria siparia CBS 279.74 TaxID=1314801 RepID=A0A6G1KAV6_9PLEO|nr:peptidase S41 family protein-like protein [Pleomassaria siparia CBS 279.74]
MVLLNSIVGLSLASIASASPLHARQNASSPCAAVAASVATQTIAVPTVPAQLAYDCITSVPFNQSAALALVDGIVPYVKWQSTTAYLKDPPAEYIEKIQDPVDLWADLGAIRDKVVAGDYTNEFEFGWDVYIFSQQTHDGHFVFVPDVIGTVFNWARQTPLVSVSADGVELPKPYVYSDILAESFNNITYIPSPVYKINGKDALEFLEDWSQLGSLQDRDALYNNVFYELASVSLGGAGAGIGTFAGSGRGRWPYPGAETTLEFENGTTLTYSNYARVLIPFDGITDGESLYQLWFTGNQPTATEAEPGPSNSTTPSPTLSATATAATTTTTTTSIPAPGYPPPVLREENNLIGGYYLDGEYSDVAVLSVPSFVSLDTAEIPFQQIGEKFLAAARAAGKTKLVIDVSANGGGTILQGYDLYKQLFPDGIGHATADPFRAFESTDLIGQKFSEVSEGLPRELVDPNENATLYELTYEVVSYVFNYQSDVDVNGKNFPSWEAKFGPVERHGDTYSNLIRWNLSDVLTPLNSGGIYIHGYGNLTNFTQPFAAEDITVVTDGYCASTCTIFSELMRKRGGVKYVSLGGRSKAGATQAIGGVKGTNNFPWTYIQFLAQYTHTLGTTAESAYYNTTELGDYWNNTVFDRQAIGSSVNVNFRDGIRDGDETQTPAQFIYEESDCRILYTKEMSYDVTAIWKAVADSAWGGKSHCVAGALGGYGKKMTKRERSVQDKVLARSQQMWRRGVSVDDYPLDVFTDLRGGAWAGNAIMYP